jgi:hypothetical protein
MLTLPQYCYLYEIMYILVGVSFKIALGIFYLRIAFERWQILLIKCVVFGSVMFGFVCIFLVVFQCVPGRCIPLFQLSLASWAHDTN